MGPRSGRKSTADMAPDQDVADRASSARRRKTASPLPCSPQVDSNMSVTGPVAGKHSDATGSIHQMSPHVSKLKGSKRPRRESAEPSRKSERGQKMRKSESYQQLENMMFSDTLIEPALRAFPDSVAAAIEYILALQADHAHLDAGSEQGVSQQSESGGKKEKLKDEKEVKRRRGTRDSMGSSASKERLRGYKNVRHLAANVIPDRCEERSIPLQQPKTPSPSAAAHQSEGQLSDGTQKGPERSTNARNHESNVKKMVMNGSEGCVDASVVSSDKQTEQKFDLMPRAPPSSPCVVKGSFQEGTDEKCVDKEAHRDEKIPRRRSLRGQIPYRKRLCAPFDPPSSAPTTIDTHPCVDEARRNQERQDRRTTPTSEPLVTHEEPHLTEQEHKVLALRDELLEEDTVLASVASTLGAKVPTFPPLDNSAVSFAMSTAPERERKRRRGSRSGTGEGTQENGDKAGGAALTAKENSQDFLPREDLCTPVSPSSHRSPSVGHASASSGIASSDHTLKSCSMERQENKGGGDDKDAQFTSQGKFGKKSEASSENNQDDSTSKITRDNTSPCGGSRHAEREYPSDFYYLLSQATEGRQRRGDPVSIIKSAPGLAMLSQNTYKCQPGRKDRSPARKESGGGGSTKENGVSESASVACMVVESASDSDIEGVLRVAGGSSLSLGIIKAVFGLVCPFLSVEDSGSFVQGAYLSANSLNVFMMGRKKDHGKTSEPPTRMGVSNRPSKTHTKVESEINQGYRAADYEAISRISGAAQEKVLSVSQFEIPEDGEKSLQTTHTFDQVALQDVKKYLASRKSDSRCQGAVLSTDCLLSEGTEEVQGGKAEMKQEIDHSFLREGDEQYWESAREKSAGMITERALVRGIACTTSNSNNSEGRAVESIDSVRDLSQGDICPPSSEEHLKLLRPPTQCKDIALLDLWALALDKLRQMQKDCDRNAGWNEQGGGQNIQGGHENYARLNLCDLGVYPGSVAAHLLSSYGVKQATLALTSTNGHNLRFSKEELGFPLVIEDALNVTAGTLEETPATSCRRRRALLPPDECARWIRDVTANPVCRDSQISLSPPSEVWVAHHYGAIVWKLACLERAFPEVLGGRYLTRPRVLQQLRYRAYREMVCGHRSALRMILNGDASAGRLMILCVSRVYHRPIFQTSILNNASLSEKTLADEQTADDAQEKESENLEQAESTGGTSPSTHARIELTDGWYYLDAVLDNFLSAFVRTGRIRVGTKVAICGALLQGLSGGGIDPLEMLDQSADARPCLQLVINGTRPARWDAPLGFQRRPSVCSRGVMSTSVSGLVAGGGSAPAIEAVVVRRYATQFMERRINAEGERLASRVLSVAEEEDAQQRHEGVCQARMERLLEEKTQQAEEENRERRHRRQGNTTGLGSGQEWETGRTREMLHTEICSRVEEARNEVLKDPSCHRESKPFFRVKICSVKSRHSHLPSTSVDSYKLSDEFECHSFAKQRQNLALLTVWEPSEELEEALQDGRHVMLYGITAPPNKSDGPAPSLFRLYATGKSTKVVPLSSYSGKDGEIKNEKCSSSCFPFPLGHRSVFDYASYQPRNVLKSIREAKERFDSRKGPFLSVDFDIVGLRLLSITWDDASPRALAKEQDTMGTQGIRGEKCTKRNSNMPVRTRIFLTDASSCILCVEKRDYDAAASERGMEKKVDMEQELCKMGKTLSENCDVYALTDLVFQSYDPKTDTVMASLSVWSGMRKEIPPRARNEAYLRNAMADLSRWLKLSSDAPRVLEGERDRLFTLLNRGKMNEVQSGGEHRFYPRQRIQGSITQHEIIFDEVQEEKVSERRRDTSLKLLVDLGGQAYISVLCRRQYALRRLATSLLPAGLDICEDMESTAEALIQHQAQLGSISIEMLVQRLEIDALDAPLYEVLDVAAIPAIQHALGTLNSLLVDKTGLSLMTASITR